MTVRKYSNNIVTCNLARYLIVYIIFYSSCTQKKGITISAVGDVYFTHVSTDVIESDAIKISGDVCLCNLEGIVDSNYSTNDIRENKLTMPVEVLPLIKQIGFNAVSLANNHSLDKGWTPYYTSKALLHENAFHIAGIKDSGFVFHSNEGTDIRVFGCSYRGPNNVTNINRIAELIRSFKQNIVVVTAHMGTEDETSYKISGGMEYYMQEQRGDVRKFAHACIDAGADIVLGHGPHVLREAELYKNRIIFYSLGNFIFTHPKFIKKKDLPTVSVRINLNDTGEFMEAVIDSYIVNNGLPYSDENGTGYNIIERLSKGNGLIFQNNKIIPNIQD